MTRVLGRLASLTLTAGLVVGGSTLVAAPAQASTNYETFHTFAACDQARRAWEQSGITIVRPCFPVRVSGGYETYYRFIHA